MTSHDSNEAPLQAETNVKPAPAPAAQRWPEGFRLGKYAIVRHLASGGMSEIYEAEHLGLRKRVALKLLRADLAAPSETRQRFLAEGMNAARIRHTNVVDVTDVGMVQDLPYLVMALLEGENLAALFDREGRLAVPDLIDILLPVASAVAAGHAQGIVHRDLKPDNIFLHREGCRVIPKVLDFGISRAMNAQRITLSSSVFGTPQYMSPEQACGAATDARSDQYALGVMIYEGVTGRLPRDSHNPLELLHALSSDAFQPPSDHVELPPGLETAILRAMAHEPEARFASMRDLALALLPFASTAARDYWKEELRIERQPHQAPGAPLVARHASIPPRSPLATPMPFGSAAASVVVAVAPALRLQPPPPLAVIDSLQPAVASATPKAPASRRRLGVVAALSLLLVALSGGWVVVQLRDDRRPAAASYPAPGPVSPPKAIVPTLMPPPRASQERPSIVAAEPAPHSVASEAMPSRALTRANAPSHAPTQVRKQNQAAVASARPAVIAPARSAVDAPRPVTAEIVPATAPRVDVIETRVPRVRVIDELEPSASVLK